MSLLGGEKLKNNKGDVIMKDWWKSPVLQGPENDYGDYDYLIEEIPANSEQWSRCPHKCDECHKERKLNLVCTGYFRTMDGWDCMDSYECWKCYLKRKVKATFRAIKKKIEYIIATKIKWRGEYYELKKMCEEGSGRPLTKDIKKTLKRLAKKEAARRS